MNTALTRDQVRAAIRFGGPPRPPRANSLWHNPATLEAHGDAFRAILEGYPDDTINVGMTVSYWQAPEDDPSYRYAFGGKVKPDHIPHFAYSTSNRPEGGLILAAGNAILPDTPLENLHAYVNALRETLGDGVQT
jgi:hypothetical protein